MRLLLFLSVFVLAEAAISQSTDGYMLYNIEVTAIDSSLENRQAAGMLQGSNMELYWAKDKSRLNFKMGDIYSTTMVLDFSSNFMLMLYDGMNGKTASLNVFDESQIAQPKVDSNVIVKLLDGTKVILGYTCRGAISMLNGVESIYWYTDEIGIAAKGQQITHPNIPGFPLYFSTITDGVLMEYQVASLLLDEIQDDTVFTMEVPEGYLIQE